MGAGLTVRGGGGTIQNSAGVTNTTLVNEGTILANTNNFAGGGLTIATTHFTNAAGGSLQATTPNSLLGITSGTWLNQSPLTITGGTLSINAASWSNQSTIHLASGALNLGGSFSQADLGTITRTNGTAGTISLTGTLNNVGDTLTLDSSANGLGTWDLFGGRINGGTIVTQNGAQLTATRVATNTLDAVTLATGSDLILANSQGAGNIVRVDVLNGLTIDGRVTIGYYSWMFANGTQTWAGNGEMLFDGSLSALFLNQSNMTLTFGPSLLIRGRSGIITNFPNVVPNITNTTLINQGTILSDVPNGIGFTIDSSNFTNTASGSLQVNHNAGSLNINSPTWLNQGPITIIAGTLSINSTNWSNQNEINLNSGTVNLGGNFSTTGLGKLTRFGGTTGTVNLIGNLNNQGATLELDTAANGTGSWNLIGGKITGGTIVTRNGAQLVAEYPTSTLDAVKLAAGSDLVVTTVQSGRFSDLYVINGMTIDGRVSVRGDGRLFTTGTQAINGVGELRFDSNSSGTSWFLHQSNMTLTIGPDLTLSGGTVRILNTNNVSVFPPVIVTNTTLVNKGTIQADISGRTFTIDSSVGVFRNEGTMQSLLGGTLTVAAPSFANSGTIRARQGTTLTLLSNTAVDQAGLVTSQIGSTTSIRRNLTGATQNPSQLTLRGMVRLEGSGTAGAPQLLEAMSNDVGNVAAGMMGNFAYGSLILANNTYVRLVDGADNANGTGPEAVYTNSLLVSAGTTLDLNGLHLYARATQIAGTIVGGSVTLIPDGGPLVFGEPTPGAVSVANEVDTWTFFGRAGQTVRTTVSTGSSSSYPPLSPTINNAQVQVRDPNGNILATASNGTTGSDATLTGVTLPVDGVYQIRVQAAPSAPSSTGKYVISAWETTIRTSPLVLNQTARGQLSSVYAVDKWTFAAVANQQVQFDLINTEFPGIAFDLNGPSGFVGFTGITADSNLVTLPSSGTYTLTVRSTSSADGAYTFRLNQTSQTQLALGTFYNGTIPGTGFAQLFKIDVPDFRPLLIQFHGLNNSDRIEVYARQGAPPTRQQFDAHNVTVGADHQLSVPYAIPGAWYLLVYGDALLSPSNFTLTVDSPTVRVLDISPGILAMTATETLSLHGLGFLPGTQVAILPQAGGAPLTAQNVSIETTEKLSATFDLTGASSGIYDVRATLPTGISHTLAEKLSVNSGTSNLVTRLILPGALGRHQSAKLTVEYSNTGTVSMDAPILVLKSNDPDDSDHPQLSLDLNELVKGHWTSASANGFNESVQIYAQGETPGLLLPGETVKVDVIYGGLKQPWDLTDTQIEFVVLVQDTGNTTAIDWPPREEALRPFWIAADAWSPIFDNLQVQIGPTWGDYSQMIKDNNNYLQRIGQSMLDAERIFGFEVAQAIGISPISDLAVASDASLATPGLPLTFSRSFGNTITERYQLGPFGRGWATPWQQSLSLVLDGTVIVHESANSQRIFQPDSRTPGKYFSSTGDFGTLRMVSGGAFELTETDGNVTRFYPDGRLELRRDANGNSITAGYGSGQLTSLTHSNGASLSIAYNIDGRIASISDSLGRVVTYGYDPASQHLLTVTDISGTTTYTYSTGTGASREHALTSVTDASGVSQFYEYNSFGRLTATYSAGNTGRISLTYGSEGQVTVTDSAGVASKLYFNGSQYVARTEAATGYYRQSLYDTEFHVVHSTDAIGRRDLYTWARAGGVKTLTDTLNHTTTIVSGNLATQPKSLIDANGNAIQYTYDARGNLVATTYADTTVEQTTYDVAGNPDVLTNRRGQTLDLNVNVNGHVTHESRSDGTSADYTYDTYNRLSTATDSRGTTTLTYDNADRVTRIDYPNGVAAVCVRLRRPTHADRRPYRLCHQLRI